MISKAKTHNQGLMIRAFNDGYEKGKTDAIEECIQIVQKIKDDYNDAKFGEQIPINYGTICGIIISLERLKEQNK